MFRHLFKLIWNKKKQNFLLIMEMFFSFLVMFGVSTVVVYYYHNYRQPMGFDYDDVWVVNYQSPYQSPENLGSTDSVVMFQDALTKMLKSMPQIEEVSFTSPNVPFSMSTNNTGLDYGNNVHIMSNVYQCEDSYQKVLDFKMLEGRWFNNTDIPGKYVPAVINEKLKEELFGNEPAIGKIIGEDVIETNSRSDRYRVIGVADNMKDKGDYQAIENGMFLKMDTGWRRWNGNILLKVKPTADAAFEGKLFKAVSNAVGSSIEIEHLDKKLVTKDRVMVVPMIIALIVVGFLIINVALGLFGVLWYNINKRKSEIGLRRAVGASGNGVSKQLLGEALVLSTLALITGSLLAVQFPLLNVFDLPASVYVIALFLAVAFIYLLVVVCALYPGKQAAAIYPAVALHEE
jgi:putative ABC transport system permease protein